MSMYYKLVKRNHPTKKDVPAKWYAVPNSNLPLEGKAMTRAATANTSLASIEMEAAFELLAAFVPQQLRQGHTVKIPGLGSFRLTFKSEGVEDINDFQASSMIKNVRILFKPDSELRTAVLTGLSFQDGGVLDNKINYASLADYRLAMGLTAGGSDGGSSSGGGTSSGGGSSSGGSTDSGDGSDDNQGENPLG